eukprot:gene3663-4180_t
MCGIWALFGYDHSVSSEIHHALLIAHRGPDFFRLESIPHFNHCCLAFHRLSIVDDLYGQQPLRVHELPHVHLIYNGEIYNFKALGKKYGFNYSTSMDGEAILHLYNKFGAKKTAQLLDGVFAFCIVDTEKKQVHLGRDTFGVRPLFSIETADGELGICSEAKGLIGLSEGNGQISSLKQFPPAHYASYDLDEKTGKVKLIEQAAYTDVKQPQLFDIPVQLGNDIKENIRELLVDAVRKRLMSDRRIGCLLSGGLDSSLIAALVVKLAKEHGITYPIQTFSTGMPGSTDLKAARKVADMLGTEHHEIIFSPEDGFDALRNVIWSLESYDITTVRASVGMYLVSKYISENTDSVVIFSGEGSDELAQGYIYFHKAPTAADADVESKRLLGDLYLYDNLRADRTTAAHGLELRVPFLDKAFTSYFLSVPAEMRQPQKGVEKYLLRSSFDGYLKGLLPDEVLWRAKEAFSDGVSSMEKPWFTMLQEYCSTQLRHDELAAAKKIYSHNTPQTEEACFYRRVFEKAFPSHHHFIPYFWMPKWIEGASDPSARTLKHFQQ